MSPPLDMPIAISANFLRFELVVNLKTAKDIGHEVPKGLLLRAVAALPGSSDAPSQSVAARRASLVSYSLSGVRYGASMVRVRFRAGIACNHHRAGLVRHAAWVP